MLNSLKEPTRCRNHSRATKIGARMWNRNELCSNGVPWRSRLRKRIRPASASCISSFRRAKLTRAAFATERSVAIDPSSRTKPWSRTRIASSAMTLSVVATPGPSLVVSPADIAAHWHIELREPLEPLATIRNLVVRSGAYVIRDSAVTVESVRWEHELLGFLHPQVPEVVAPLTAPDGSTYLVADGRVVSVLPFVDGARAKRSDTRVRHDLPRLLARLHRAALDWPGARPRPGRPSWRELDWVV